MGSTLPPSLAISKKSPVSGLILLPQTNGGNSITTDTTNGNCINMQLPAPGKFYGARLIFKNYSTTVPMIIDSVKVAPVAIRAGGSVTVQQNQYLTFGSQATFNGSTSVTIPVATAGAGAQVIPSFVITDLIIVDAIARTDYPAEPYLLRVATHLAASNAASTYHFNYSGTYVAAFDTLAANPGLRIATQNFSGASATAAAMTGAAYSVSEQGGCMNPVGAIFYTDNESINMVTVGDSLVAGHGSLSEYAGWPEYLMMQNYNTSTNQCAYSVENHAESGQLSIDSMATLKAVLAAYPIKPKLAVFKAYSPNDGTTQANADKAWALCLDAIQYCNNYNVQPVVLTSWAAAGTNWSVITTQNNRVLNLPSSVITIDVGNYVSPGGTINSGWNIAANDGVHLNDAGYAAVAAYIKKYLPT